MMEVIITKKCVICSKEFEPENHNQKCCTAICVMKLFNCESRIVNKFKYCKTCNTEFKIENYRQVYCNDLCNPKFKNKIKHCGNCNNKFVISSSRNRYCQKCSPFNKINRKY